MAGRLQSSAHEPYWLLEDFCEKASISLVSRHPGDRHRNDLLGQRAQRPVHPVVAGGPAATADTAASVAGNAAGCAASSEHADSVVADSVVQHAEHAGIFTKPVIAEPVDSAEQHAGPVRAAAGFAGAFDAGAVFFDSAFFDSGCDRS